VATAATHVTTAATAAAAAVRYQLSVGVDAMVPGRQARVPLDTAVNDVPAGPVHLLVNAC